MMFRNTASRGWPLRSYIASRNAGSMTTIIAIAAVLVLTERLSKKKSGTPRSAPPPKQTSCLFVRFIRTLLFTLLRSLGTLT